MHHLIIFFRKQHQSLRETLNEQINTLKKEKEYLRIKVDDLTRKNEVIQDSIKQKIKGSVYGYEINFHSHCLTARLMVARIFYLDIKL